MAPGTFTSSLDSAFDWGSDSTVATREGAGREPPSCAGPPSWSITLLNDAQAGLIYYGHRFYSPNLGRFINRDPIEEQGGINLYAFVRNNAINAWDYLGQDAQWDYGAYYYGGRYNHLQRASEMPGGGGSGAGIVDALRVSQAMALTSSISQARSNAALAVVNAQWSNTVAAVLPTLEASNLSVALSAVQNSYNNFSNRSQAVLDAQATTAYQQLTRSGSRVNIESLDAGGHHILTDGTRVQIVIKINYNGSGADPELTERFNRGIEEWWQGDIGRYKLKTFATTSSDEDSHRVLVVPGNFRSTAHTWSTHASDWDVAHEAGHLFGLGEGYDPATGIPYPKFEKSIMGKVDMPPTEADVARVIEIARGWSQKRGGGDQ